MLALPLRAAYIGLGGGVSCRAASGQRSLVSAVAFCPCCGGCIKAFGGGVLCRVAAGQQ